MLIRLTQNLNLIDKLFVFLALNSDDDGETTHGEGCGQTVIFCDCLKVRYIEATGRFLENIGKVLCHETI